MQNIESVLQNMHKKWGNFKNTCIENPQIFYQHIFVGTSVFFVWWLLSAVGQNNDNLILRICAYIIPIIIGFAGIRRYQNIHKRFVVCAALMLLVLYAVSLLDASWTPKILAAVSSLVLSLMACFGMSCACEMYHHPWCKGEMDRDTFRNAELRLSMLRGLIYIVCFMCIVLAICVDGLAKNTYFMFFAVALSLPLYVAILQTTFRLTFRRIANYAISLVNVIVYLTMLDMAYLDKGILGFIGEPSIRSELENLLKQMPDTVKTGLLITLVVALLKDSVGNLLSTITSPHPANQSQRRRRNRRRLLTHWHYHRDATVSTRRDSAVELLVIEVFIFCIVIIFSVILSGAPRASVPDKTGAAQSATATATTEESSAATEDSTATTEESSATTEDSSATTEEPSATTEDSAATTEEPSVATEDSTATTEKSSATTEESADNPGGTSDNEIQIPFAIYPLSVAIIIFIPAIMSTWNITDERLIQSEHTYLALKSSQLYPEDVAHGTPHWQDFCQVLVNVYNNVSGLTSEDFGFHHMKDMLGKLHSYISNNNELSQCGETSILVAVCAGSRFYSDILAAKGNVDEQTLRESLHDDMSGHEPALKNNALQRTRDAQFANEIMDLLSLHYHAVEDKLSQQGSHENVDILSQPSMFQLECMAETFFEDREHVWGQRFGAYNISADEGIRLLKMDTIIHILQRETPNKQGCGLTWLCGKCIQNDPAEKEKMAAERQRNRAELMFLYPFLVLECYDARWSPRSSSFLLADEIAMYYKKMIEKGYYIDHHSLEEAITNIFRYFLETDADYAYLVFALEYLESLEDGTVRVTSKKARANRKFTDFCEQHKATYKKLAAEFTKHHPEKTLKEIDDEMQTLFNNISRIMHDLFTPPWEQPTPKAGEENVP